MAEVKNRKTIISGLSKAVVIYDINRCVELSRVALQEGINADDAAEKGLFFGITQVYELYRTQRYCLSEVLVCVDAFKAGIEVLKPYIRSRAVMCTVSHL